MHLQRCFQLRFLKMQHMSICLNDPHVFRPFVYIGTIQQDFITFPLITIEIFFQSLSCTYYSYMENPTIQNKDNKDLPHIEINRA